MACKAVYMSRVTLLSYAIQRCSVTHCDLEPQHKNCTTAEHNICSVGNCIVAASSTILKYVEESGRSGLLAYGGRGARGINRHSIYDPVAIQ